jgi:hypothetical protein
VLGLLGSAHSLSDKGIVEKRRLQLALLGRILEKRKQHSKTIVSVD